MLFREADFRHLRQDYMLILRFSSGSCLIKTKHLPRSLIQNARTKTKGKIILFLRPLLGQAIFSGKWLEYLENMLLKKWPDPPPIYNNFGELIHNSKVISIKYIEVNINPVDEIKIYTSLFRRCSFRSSGFTPFFGLNRI